ncbi:MAG TPA: hypothetical protein VD866_02105, partial [Urbifossiella sp.]|nr:hypothetical protein [Urbifossiella sp.]
RFHSAFPARGGAEVWLVMTAKKFEIECYDVATRKLVRTLRPEPADPARPFASAGLYTTASPDGTAFTSNTDKQRFYDGTTGKSLTGLPPNVSGMEGGLVLLGSRYLGRSLGPSDDAKVLSRVVVVCDWRAGRPLAVLTGITPGGGEVLAAFSPDGRTVVAAVRDGTEAYVYDVSSTAE